MTESTIERTEADSLALARQEIQAKDYATQRGLRIPVYDHDFRPPGQNHIP